MCFLLILYSKSSSSQTINRYDIIIDEIMIDPSPVIGLPNNEFIELKNISNTPFNLSGLQIIDASSTAIINVSYTLQPDSLVIICSNGTAAQFSLLGPAIGVNNFPSLDNDGELLYLRSKENKTIHAVNYSKSWYKNSLKAEGGWTLEMIDVHNACNGFSNWSASIDTKGGTPGKINSINASMPDKIPPAIVRGYASDSLQLVLTFSESLDSITATFPNFYNLNDVNVSIIHATPIPPLFEKVMLQLGNPLQRNKVYVLTSQSLKDCAGNEIEKNNSIGLGWASPPGENDIIINEILFNPKPSAVDYVELYNRSEKIIDAKDLYISNRNSMGNPGVAKQVSSENRLLFPGKFLLITEDTLIIQHEYTVKQPEALTEIKPMPSLPDDKGTVLLLNIQGIIIDELQYDAKWHFPLIDNAEGVALERMNYNKSTQDKQNWHSAATNIGYGTPGYQNSQYITPETVNGMIKINPPVFSPDNDGYDDVATINYRFPEPGYVCNISIYDSNGRLIKSLVRNALCGVDGYFRWDGLDEQNKKLNIGVYIFVTDIFNVNGNTKRYKNTIVLARRL